MGAHAAVRDRFVYDLDVEFDTGRKRVFGRGLDLSDQALSVRADASIDPGTTVQVQLRLVLEWGTSETLGLTGLVIWCTETEGAWQVGVQLVEVGNDVRQRIAVLLRVLTGTLALPAPGR